MYTRLLNIWSNFRSSFWFVPSMLMGLSTFMAFGMILFDKTYGQRIVETYPVLEMSPPAVRLILSSIVGAMVSTTGVVFSITIVALSLASSQFGSRLIRTYRNRRTTHFTLGIFVSTSLFCILVLASIREVSGKSFVPTASVSLGILLTVVCLATLVFYIHDMSRAIQAPNVIKHSADDLHAAIDRLFPEGFGEEVHEDASKQQLDATAFRSIDETLSAPQFSVVCAKIGYLQAIENETVMGIANQHELTIRLLVQPGDFLFDERRSAEIICPTTLNDEELERLKDSVGQAIRQSLIVGSERTHIQDIRHAFDELVDIAVRALSPGINDPFTAVNCVDRIHAALMILRKRKMPSAYRLNDEGELRVIAEPVSLEECIDGSLGVISHYAADSPMVSVRVARAMASLSDENVE